MYYALAALAMASIVAAGAGGQAWGAQLDAVINPGAETSPFRMAYQKTIFLEYGDGGALSDELLGKEWTLAGTLGQSSPEALALAEQLNRGILEDRSQVRVSDLEASYKFDLRGRDLSATIDMQVIIEGMLSNYVITSDSQKSLVELGWRGLSVSDEVYLDGMEVNFPINVIRDQEPGVYALLEGTAAEDVLGLHLLNGDFILEQEMGRWHFLFNPAGIGVDANQFGLSDEIAGFVVSQWTLGESSFREGRQVERVFTAEFVVDRPYKVTSVRAADSANIDMIGFGVIDTLDGIEIAGVTPNAPENYNTATGGFPIFIIYGMAGLAAVAGIAFFFVSSRSLKNEAQGQQGIDPTRLVGYETSTSSGGYKTNRGEAQLAEESSYQQTRSVYEAAGAAPPPPAPAPAAEEAACGCAASAEMGSECDCEMQGSCLCDATCGCAAQLCRDHSGQMG